MVEKNDQYIFKAKELLKLITSSGGEAYIVGESLHDIVLDQVLEQIEIFTTLPKENALLLFCDYNCIQGDNSLVIHYFGFKFKISFPIILNTKEKQKTKITKRHYSTSLMDFLEQKDFTINTLAMGSNNVIYDCFNGREDLNKKKVKLIYDNPSQFLAAKPSKILSAIALVSRYGYRLDKELLAAIKKKRKLIKNLELDEITKQLKEIYEGNYFKKALKILIKTKVYKRLSLYRFDLKRLYKNYVVDEFDIFLATTLTRTKQYNEIVGCYSSNEYEFQMLCNLAITNPKSDYDKMTLYSCGLDLCLKANKVNFYLGKVNKKVKVIQKAYEALPIKKTCDLKFKGEDIISLLDEEYDNSISQDEIVELIDDIILSVLNKELKNDYKEIMEYVCLKLQLLGGKKRIDETNKVEEKTIDTDNNIENNFEEAKEFFDEDNDELDLEFNELKKKQLELSERVSELELMNLELELDKEIERKIKQSGLLEGLSGNFHSSTYETLRKVYYDVLINTEKYERLKEKNE